MHAHARIILVHGEQIWCPTRTGGQHAAQVEGHPQGAEKHATPSQSGPSM